MHHLYPGFLLLVLAARTAFLVLRRRSTMAAPLPPAELAGRLAAGVGLPVLLAIFDVDLSGALWVMQPLLSLPLDLLAAWVLARVIAHAWCTPRWRLRLAAGIALLVMSTCAWSSREIAVGAYLLRHQAQYQRVLAHIQAGPLEPDGSFEGVTYIVEPGPTRVAFPWPGGIVDNWFGAVHDPSGSVLRAPHDDWLRRLFGGDLIGVRHLWGPWYLCSFT